MRSQPPVKRATAAVAPAKGAGGLAVLAFTIGLGCAFWAGAVLASLPAIH